MQVNPKSKNDRLVSRVAFLAPPTCSRCGIFHSIGGLSLAPVPPSEIDASTRINVCSRLSDFTMERETKMTTRTILAAVTALSLIAVPAIAQSSSSTEQNGHHYSGGPKTEVPHHMGKKETVGLSTKGSSRGHVYSGGPKTEVPHDMDAKRQ
jgi:hypothetical protein